VEASEAFVVDFLTRLVRDSGATRVHVIAHSMGNRVTLRSFQRILAQASEAAPVHFGQVFLAAPDVDVDTFKQLAVAYPQLSQRTTLYISPKDVAVAASEWLHDFNRVGLCPPVTIVPGIDTIEVPKFDLLSLGHAYFAEAAAVLHDMFDLILLDVSPEHRQRLERVTLEDGGVYWRLRR
jgi:esterase/lipase superfamily enzyme